MNCDKCTKRLHKIDLIGVWQPFISIVKERYNIHRVDTHICVVCDHLLHFYDGSKLLGMGRGKMKIDKNGDATIKWSKVR